MGSREATIADVTLPVARLPASCVCVGGGEVMDLSDSL